MMSIQGVEAVWLVGRGPGKPDMVEAVPYNSAFEAMTARMVRAGRTHLYVDGMLVFQVLAPRLKPSGRGDYTNDVAFVGHVCLTRGEGKSVEKIANWFGVHHSTIYKVLEKLGEKLETSD